MEVKDVVDFQKVSLEDKLVEIERQRQVTDILHFTKLGHTRSASAQELNTPESIFSNHSKLKRNSSFSSVCYLCASYLKVLYSS